jgi:hypothetical protein
MFLDIIHRPAYFLKDRPVYFYYFYSHFIIFILFVIIFFPRWGLGLSIGPNWVGFT